MPRTILLVVLLALPVLGQPPLATEVFSIDPTHSGVNFSVRHFAEKVPGQFRDFEGTIAINRAHPERSSVELTIQAATINTADPDRDRHLRSADFFDVAKFPTISFKSTSVRAKGKDQFDVTGDLTMHGVTKRITLPVKHLGSAGAKANFEITTSLNRKDYGINWNRVLDSGKVVLDDTVHVSINVEANRK